MENNTVYLMTYGSLMNGFYNHCVMEEAQGEFVGKAITSDSRYRMISVGGHYPAIIDGEGKFTGEVYKLSQENLEQYIDKLEGYPNFYNRDLISVELEDGKQIMAYYYFLNEDSYSIADESFDETNYGLTGGQLKKDSIYRWVK